MFSKTTIALGAALILATTFAAAAQTPGGSNARAQARGEHGQQVKPFTEFEKLWFKQVEGNRD
jgi:Spy/CpxP family protein refolding chaperone